MQSAPGISDTAFCFVSQILYRSNADSTYPLTVTTFPSSNAGDSNISFGANTLSLERCSFEHPRSAHVTTRIPLALLTIELLIGFIQSLLSEIYSSFKMLNFSISEFDAAYCPYLILTSPNSVNSAS